VTKLSVKSFQHNETNTVNASLPVYCHSSSYRYFKFDFKTLCTPMMPEYGFSCQQWRHYENWKCVQCTSWDAGAETRSSATVGKLETGILIFLTQQYSMAVGLSHVAATCDRRSMADVTDISQAHWQVGGNVGTGNCRQAFSYVWGLQWHTIRRRCILCNPTTEVVWKLFHSVLCFHVFVFPFPFRLSGFLRFFFAFALTESLFFR